MNSNPVIAPPDFGEETDPFRRSSETIELLARRRSTVADLLSDPGPSELDLQQILRIAARAPDHGRVTPFRFVVFEGDARAEAGEALAKAFAAAEPDAPDAHVEKERVRFLRAPVVIAVVARLKPEHKVPVWEQTLTVGAVGQNMLVAANAHGFAAQWLTEWYAYDDNVKAAFGLSEDEDFAGFVYIGSASMRPRERARPAMDDIVSHYGA